MFAANGLDVQGIFAEAGIDLADLQKVDARVPTEQSSKLWEVATERTGNPAIGLINPDVPRPNNFDVVGFTMISSPTLRAALERFARYMRVVSDAASIDLEDVEEGVRLRFGLFGGSYPIPRQRMEYDLLTILTFSRWVSARKIIPLTMNLVWKQPADLKPYQEAFQCPLVFDADFDGFVFAHGDLDFALPAHNPMVAAMHDNLVMERMARMDGQSIAHRVREQIIVALPDGEPRREQIASALNLSDRTLQRRLREENTSYDRLLDTTRCELAQQYLARSTISVAEVAYLLGFADQSNFFRACKRWFEISPGQYRARLLG